MRTLRPGSPIAHAAGVRAAAAALATRNRRRQPIYLLTARPYSSALSTVYKGCTPDAPRMPTGLAMVQPVRTPRTPNVHPLYTALLGLGKSWGLGAPGRGGKRCVWPVLGGGVPAKVWRGPSPILAFSLSLPVRDPIQAGWLNQIENYFSIIPSKVRPPNDFN